MKGLVVGLNGSQVRWSLAVVGLFAVLPFLHFLAENPDYEIPIGRLLAYYLLGVVLLAVLVAAVGSISRSEARRVAAVAGLSFYSFGYLSVALRDVLGVEPILGVDGSLWLTGIVVLSALLLTRWKWTQTYVFLLGVLLVAGLVVQIVVGRYLESETIPSIFAQPLNLSPSVTPNIYWFVLDGYGRGDVLENEYGYTDQDQFISELSSRGIDVSEGAVAGYPLTYLSMASTLVLDYLAHDDTTLYDPDPYIALIRGENRVVATLKSWGYEYVHVDNGWTGSGCSDVVDVCVATRYVGEVESVLMSMTPFPDVMDGVMSGVESERKDPLIALERIRGVQPESPFFAQIHLINPHPPYLWTGQNCDLHVVPNDLTAPYGHEEYVDAIRCLNRRLLMTIDEVQAGDEKAIIILQGDHGPAQFGIHGAPIDRWAAHDLWVRFGVLNAMRLPGECTAPRDMALVNTFRVVFDCIAVEEVALHRSRAWLVNVFPGAHKEVTPPHASPDSVEVG